jgi:mono/diheme cytochrome c family protein
VRGLQAGERWLSRRWIFGLIGVGGVAVLAFLAVTWRPAIAPIDPPVASSFAVEQVANGEKLAIAASCVECHTAQGGARGAGGVYASRGSSSVPSINITPDPDTGIGRWSLPAFTRALREGVARDGSYLLPAFPFDHFTKLTDQDIGALYAYLMTLPPVKAPVASTGFHFPPKIRALQAIWNAIYVELGAFQPDPTRGAQWNRGAYLAEAAVLCSSCHTPRNMLGAEQAGHPYGSGRSSDGWWSAPLDIPVSPARWTEAQMVDYLRTGESVPHGVALGDMQKVVHALRALPDSDLAAIATYIVSLARPSGPAREMAVAKAQSLTPPRNDTEVGWSKVYQANCADCHDRPGATPQSARSPVGLATSLWMEEPNNFVRIMLDGIQREDGAPGPTMPGFRDKLNDGQMAAIASYLRTSRTVLTPWSDIQMMVARIRAFSAVYVNAR